MGHLSGNRNWDACPVINSQAPGGCDLILPLATDVQFLCQPTTVAAGAGLNNSLHCASIITKQIRREGKLALSSLKLR